MNKNDTPPFNPSIKKNSLIKAIDALLPQTQCQDCSYAGCLPYARAIVTEGEKIDRCLPGGVKTLRHIAAQMKQDPEPYVAEMTKKQKATAIAVIREPECIGCTKCIQACPVDAIIGANKQMHTIITDVCTGCGLCLPPCPVDCIDLLPIPEYDETKQQQMAEQSRQRYERHQTRLTQDNKIKRQQHQLKKLQMLNLPMNEMQANEQQNTDRKTTVTARQSAIKAALARVAAKKLAP